MASWKAAELRPLGRRLRERMHQVEAEVAEEELLQEARRRPLGLARLLGDLPGLGFADVLAGGFAHAE